MVCLLDAFRCLSCAKLHIGKNLTIVLHHADKTQESFEVKHTYNKQQIAWVKAGSALNKIRKDRSAAFVLE